MVKVNGAQSVETIPGRRIVLSAGVGITTIDELKWLSKTILEYAADWKNSGWAYIADCSKMSPTTNEESEELVTMTKKLVDAGCKALGFSEGSSVMLKLQAHKNTLRSETNVLEGHFATVDQVLDWLENEVNI